MVNIYGNNYYYTRTCSKSGVIPFGEHYYRSDSCGTSYLIFCPSLRPNISYNNAFIYNKLETGFDVSSKEMTAPDISLGHVCRTWTTAVHMSETKQHYYYCTRIIYNNCARTKWWWGPPKKEVKNINRNKKRISALAKKNKTLYRIKPNIVTLYFILVCMRQTTKNQHT
jgi:hypothetical protein